MPEPQSATDLFTELLTRYRAAQPSGPINDLRSMFGGPQTQGDVMREAQRAAPLLNLGLSHERETRAQKTQEMTAARDLMNAHRDFATLLKTFATDFHGQPEDVQNATRDMNIRLFSTAAKVGGYQFDPKDIDTTFRVKGYAEAATALLDPILDTEREVAAKDFAATKTPEDRLKVAQAWQAKADQKAKDFVSQALALIPARFPGRTNITQQEVVAVARKEFPELSKSPAVRAAFQSLLADDKLMAQYGVQSGAAALAGQQETAKIQAGLTPEVTKGKAEQAAAVKTAELQAGLDPNIQKAELAKVTKQAEAVEAIKAKYAQPQQTANLANTIRDDFTNVTKDFRTIKDSWSRINMAKDKPSPAGDLSIVFNYMKMLDPGSVVRESEFATAQNLGPIGQRIQAWYSKNLTSDGRLADEARKDLVQNAKALFQSQLSGHEEIETQFKDIATRQGVNVKDAVPDFVGGLRSREADKPKATDPPKPALKRTGDVTRVK